MNYLQLDKESENLSVDLTELEEVSIGKESEYIIGQFETEPVEVSNYDLSEENAEMAFRQT